MEFTQTVHMFTIYSPQHMRSLLHDPDIKGGANFSPFLCMQQLLSNGDINLNQLYITHMQQRVRMTERKRGRERERERERELVERDRE
jgi:hypothetical protein